LSNYSQSGSATMKQVFDRYIEDSITEEQIRRILEPVLRRIREGAFDRPRNIFYKIYMFQKRVN